MTTNNKPTAPTANNPARRRLLQNSLTASSVALIPLVATSCGTTSTQSAVSSVLGAPNDAILAAIADRIFPADSLSPAANSLGVLTYINRSLSEWNQTDVPMLTSGLQQLTQAASQQHGSAFTALNAEQQDSLLMALEQGTLTGVDAGPALFNRVHRLVLEGLFSDPYYGGNANFAGWDLLGYPGALMASTADMQKMRQRLAPLHTSAHGAEHDGH